MESQEKESAADLHFDKRHRILRRSDFQAVYNSGRRLRGRWMTLFCLPREALGEGAPLPWRLGITATRRTGGAVQRNRQRRRLREYFRLSQHQIEDGWDFVINTTAGLTTAPFPELKAELDRLVRQAVEGRGKLSAPRGS